MCVVADRHLRSTVMRSAFTAGTALFVAWFVAAPAPAADDAPKMRSPGPNQLAID
jgi:hypothetical protein